MFPAIKKVVHNRRPSFVQPRTQSRSTATTMAAHCRPAGLVVALTLLLLLLHHYAAAQKPPATCTDELVKFSPCLAYVSSPPNNLSGVVPSKCCDAFSSEFDSGEAICLCYLLQEPRIFGFPMDDAKVLSLSSVCPPSNDSSAAARTGSLQSLCSGSSSSTFLDRFACYENLSWERFCEQNPKIFYWPPLGE